MRRLLLVAAASALVAGCSSAATSLTPPTVALPSATPSAAPTAAPSPAPAASLVRGKARCDITSRVDEESPDAWVIREHFRCTNETNDPRVDGQADFDFVTTFAPPDSSVGRWVGELALRNDGGSWRGKGAGAVTLWKSADAAYPQMLNYGVDVYTGSGGYAGLTYREFVGAPGDEYADLAGWIEPTP